MKAVERRWMLVFALLGILASLTPSLVLGAAPAMDRVTVEVNVEPKPEPPSAFVCTAKIVDLESGEVLSAPRVIFLAGSPATVQTSLAAKDGAGNDVKALFEMEVAVTEDMTTASYSSRILLGEEVVNEQAFRFRLPVPEAVASERSAPSP